MNLYSNVSQVVFYESNRFCETFGYRRVSGRWLWICLIFCVSVLIQSVCVCSWCTTVCSWWLLLSWPSSLCAWSSSWRHTCASWRHWSAPDRSVSQWCTKAEQKNCFQYCFTYKVSSLLKYNEYVLSLQLFGWIGEKFKQHTVVFAVLAIMAIQGMTNLQAQWAIIGEFSNLPQEELLDWIQENTRPSEWPCLISSLPSKQ